MSKPRASASLIKHKSWSPDIGRDEVWLRRKGSFKMRRRNGASKSVTDEDLDELKGCIELGFGFGTELDPKLSNTLPALGLYCAINKQSQESLSRTLSGLSVKSDGDGGSRSSNPSVFEPGDDPEVVKARLKQWAQAVACSVKQITAEPI